MKLGGIEAARGIAAIMVVFYHVARHMRLNIGYLPMGGVTQFGHTGVDFFFVLSGFIIFYVHGKDIGKRASIEHYAQRRFIRIFPLYWFVLLLSFVLNGVFGKGGWSELDRVLFSATLLPIVENPYVGVAWTLQHELIFYMMAMLAIFSRRVGMFAFLIWLSLILAKLFTGFVFSETLAYTKFVSEYNIEFFFGMCAAWLGMRWQARAKDGTNRQNMSKVLIVSSNFLVMFGVLMFLVVGAAENSKQFDGYAPIARLIYGVSSMIVVLGLVSCHMDAGNLSTVLRRLGAASYSIYLTHFIFIGVFYKLSVMFGVFAKVPDWMMFLILSGASVAGGIAISTFIEYPLMRLVKNQIFERGTRNTSHTVG